MPPDSITGAGLNAFPKAKGLVILPLCSQLSHTPPSNSLKTLQD